MNVFDIEELLTPSGKPNITETGVKMLKKLAEIVLNCHFSYVRYCEREDLISIGITKAISLLSNGNFDMKRAYKIRGYLYTGMRNEMGNYLYRSKREILFSDVRVTETHSPDIFVEKSLYLDIQTVIDRRFPGSNFSVSRGLEDLGFEVEEPVPGISSQEIKCMVVIVLWRIKENLSLKD